MKKCFFIFFISISLQLYSQPIDYKWYESKCSPLLKGWFNELIDNVPITISDDRIQEVLKESTKLSDTTTKTDLIIGVIIPVDINLDQAFTKTNPKGRLSKISIEAKGAKGLNLYLDQFNLSQNCEMIIYNDSKDFLVGPIMGKDFNNTFSLATEIIPGSVINIELFEPFGDKKSTFHILQIGYVTNKNTGLNNPYNSTEGESKSSDCEVNVKCPTGSSLYNNRDGIAKILYQDGQYLHHSTGALLGNTSNNFIPYILTAYHCLDLNSDETISYLEKSYLSNYIFSFFHESPSCESDDAPALVSCSGASFISAYKYTDMALVQLNNANLDCRFFYNGWDVSSSMPTDLYMLHHPYDEVMKVSRDNNGSWANNVGIHVDETWFPVGYAHVIDWNVGSSQPGSSGAPYFNQNQKIVGQHTGGWAVCFLSIGYDYGGRLSYSWNTGSTSDSRLKDWLDPNNTGQLSIYGRRNGGVSGPSILCANNNYQFNLINPPNNVTISWTATPSNAFSQSSGTGSIATLSVLSSASGNGSITFSVPHPSKGSISFTSNFSFCISSGTS